MTVESFESITSIGGGVHFSFIIGGNTNFPNEFLEWMEMEQFRVKHYYALRCVRTLHAK